jgi:hypothetical protein
MPAHFQDDHISFLFTTRTTDAQSSHNFTSHINLLLETRKDGGCLERFVIVRDILCALPLLLCKRPLLHGRDWVPGLFKLVVCKALTLEHGRVLDSLEPNVVVRPRDTQGYYASPARYDKGLTEKNTEHRGDRRVADPLEGRSRGGPCSSRSHR